MTPAELLERVLGGGAPSVEELDGFTREWAKEGRLHDFKHGSVTKKERLALTRDVRQWASGFANAEGGVILFGISERQDGVRTVTGCSPLGEEVFSSWLGKLVEPIAVRCALPPRITTVPHPNGEVVLLALDRALQLIDIMEDHQRRYYLRVEDETIMAPPYLVTDLILGRRQHPVFDVHLEDLVFRGRSAAVKARGVRLTHDWLEPELSITIENHSLLEIDSLRVGTAGWTWCPPGQDDRINEQLAAYLDPGEQPAVHASGEWRLLHHPYAFNQTYTSIGLGPFDVRHVREIATPRIRVDSGYRYSFALYALARGSAPQWWQISAITPGNVGNGPAWAEEEPTMERVVGRRVTVAWRGR